MPPFALLMLQVASIAGPPAAAPPADAGESLLHPVAPEAHCAPSTSQIVVCARDKDAYRLHAVGPQIEPTGQLPKAQWRVFGNGTLSAHASGRSVGGFTAPAAMLTLTKPF